MRVTAAEVAELIDVARYPLVGRLRRHRIVGKSTVLDLGTWRTVRA